MYYQDVIQRFDTRNINLAFLASEAAIDISNYMQGVSQKDSSIKYLSKILNDATQGEAPSALQPDNNMVLGYAIPSRKNFEEYWKGKKVDEVVLQINLVAKDLRDFKSLSRKKQEHLTNFCVDLSKEITHYYNQYYSNRCNLVA